MPLYLALYCTLHTLCSTACSSLVILLGTIEGRSELLTLLRRHAANARGEVLRAGGGGSGRLALALAPAPGRLE